MKDNVNIILEKMNCLETEENQIIGRKMASKLDDLSLIIQPIGLGLSRSWENCALVLKEKSDNELLPYLDLLLEWLQDINWPGSEIIFERLKKFNVDVIKNSYEKSINRANEQDDINWLATLYLLLKSSELNGNISCKYVKILEENEKTHY